MATTRRQKRIKRRTHIRKNVYGTAEKPRLSVFKSNRYLFVQAVDDEGNIVISALWEGKIKPEKDEKPVDRAGRVGEKFGDMLKKKKVNTVVFDRGGYKYHGRLKSFAEGVRKAGIKF